MLKPRHMRRYAGKAGLASAINGAVALVGFGLAALTAYKPGTPTQDAAKPLDQIGRAHV